MAFFTAVRKPESPVMARDSGFIPLVPFFPEGVAPKGDRVCTIKMFTLLTNRSCTHARGSHVTDPTPLGREETKGNKAPSSSEPSRRTLCLACAGSGSVVSREDGALYACKRCQGRGTVPPRLHFDATGDQPGDGCNADHTRVLQPCLACGKAPDDQRHLCSLLQAEKPKPCAEHHAWEPGGHHDSTREGCMEHGVAQEFVLRWWTVADQQRARVGVCHCCLAPAPADDHGIPRGMCYRCRPRVAGGDA